MIGPATEELRRFVREIPDFPSPGILFKDITPLLSDAPALAVACEAMAAPFRAAGVTNVLAIESRGFLFGGLIANRMKIGLVPLRKPGKLPGKKFSEPYQLEYGESTLEMHVDALAANARVIVVDDVLATGGTAAAAVRLATRVGATVVGCSFFIELSFLGGRAGVGAPCESVLRY